MTRSKSTQEMVIKALIREVVYSINTSKYKDLRISQGAFLSKFAEGARSWLTGAFGIALCIFGWKLKKAIDGLGVQLDQITAAAQTAAGAASKVGASAAGVVGSMAAAAGLGSTNEVRLISEVARIKTRFDDNDVIESDAAIKLAEQLVKSIEPKSLNMDDTPDESSMKTDRDIEILTRNFNDKAKTRMREILKLCTDAARTYPGSLAKFGIPAPAISASDIDPNEKMLLEKALLDVAAIQLATILDDLTKNFYGNMKTIIDKMYDDEDEADKENNKKFTDILNSAVSDLRDDLDTMLTTSGVKDVFKA